MSIHPYQMYIVLLKVFKCSKKRRKPFYNGAPGFPQAYSLSSLSLTLPSTQAKNDYYLE